MTLVQLEAVVNIAAVMGLVALWFWAIKPAIVDIFRQSMFSLRDELFDHMAAGHIAPDHPAYVMVRERMNSYIRYAEHFSLLKVLLIATALKKRDVPLPLPYQVRLDEALNSLPAEEARYMEGVLQKVTRNFDIFITFHSFFMTLALLALGLVLMAFSNTKRQMNFLSKSRDVVDYEVAAAA